MKALIPLAVLTLAVAGCEAQTPTPEDVVAGEAEGLPPSDVVQPPAAPGGPPPPAAPTSAPSILQPIERSEWRSRLAYGGGCTLSRGDRDYVVVVPGDGAAKVGGAVIDLTGVSDDLNTLTRGGTFSGAGTTLSVTLAPDLGEGSSFEETFTKPVRVEVSSGGAVERFEAAWTCGS